MSKHICPTTIGGFREGAEGGAAPLFSYIFKMSYDFALRIVL